MRVMGEIEAIDAKLSYQTIAYFGLKIDWRGWNSAETSTTWGYLATFFQCRGLLIASAISRNLFFFIFKIKAREQVVV